MGHTQTVYNSVFAHKQVSLLTLHVCPACCREYSKQLNEHRIGVLRSREDAIQSVVKEAKAKLVQITQDQNRYTQLLTALIVQVRPSMGQAPLVCKHLSVVTRPPVNHTRRGLLMAGPNSCCNLPCRDECYELTTVPAAAALLASLL